MVERNDFLETLIETLDSIIESVEEREVDDSDFTAVREIAESLREEMDSLYQF